MVTFSISLCVDFLDFFYVFNSFCHKKRSPSWISTPPPKYHNTMPTNIFEKFHHRLGLYSQFMAAFVILNAGFMAIFNNAHFPKCEIKNSLLAHSFNKMSWNLVYICHSIHILILFCELLYFKVYGIFLHLFIFLTLFVITNIPHLEFQLHL